MNPGIVGFPAADRHLLVIGFRRRTGIVLSVDQDADVGAERSDICHIEAVLEDNGQRGAVLKLKCQRFQCVKVTFGGDYSASAGSLGGVKETGVAINSGNIVRILRQSQVTEQLGNRYGTAI